MKLIYKNKLIHAVRVALRTIYLQNSLGSMKASEVSLNYSSGRFLFFYSEFFRKAAKCLRQNYGSLVFLRNWLTILKSSTCITNMRNYIDVTWCYCDINTAAFYILQWVPLPVGSVLFFVLAMTLVQLNGDCFRNLSKMKALSTCSFIGLESRIKGRLSGLCCHIVSTCCHPKQLVVNRCFIMLGMGNFISCRNLSAVVLCWSHGPDQESLKCATL